jgi:hypothetical protein
MNASTITPNSVAEAGAPLHLVVVLFGRSL